MAHLFRDLGQYLAAVLLYPLFLVIPGYVVARGLNLFGFRRMSLFTRLLIALPLSVGVIPILIYFPWRFVNVGAAWVVMGLLWAAFASFAISDRIWQVRVPRTVVWIAVTWTLICLGVLVDVPWGHHLYLSTVVYDHGFRTSVVDGFARSAKLPPVNPFFYPGHAIPFRYHYFWFMVSSLVDRIGGSVVDARASLVGSAVWAGFAVLGAIAMFVRVFEDKRGDVAKKRALLVAAIACVSGFDVIPFVSEAVSRLSRHQAQWVPWGSIDWWNGVGQITSWVSTSIWVPNHAAGLVACVAGGLVLWDARLAEGWSPRVTRAVIAGLCFASAAGLSIFVVFIFAFLLGIVLLAAGVKRQGKIAAVIAIAGVVTVIATFPYLKELTSANTANDAFLTLGIRQFSWTDSLVGSFTSAAGRLAFQVAMLPVNYLFELGILLPIALWKMAQMWRRRTELNERDFITLSMFVVPLVLASTLKFSQGNDFEWRAWLVGQFVLLFWAADFLSQEMRSQSELKTQPRRERRMVQAVVLAGLLLGVLTNVTELLLLRTYVAGAEQGWAQSAEWVIPQASEQAYELRATLEWLDGWLPRSAVIQENPDVRDATFQGYYSHRQTSARGWQFGPTYGGNRIDYGKLVSILHPVFSGQASLEQLNEACRKTGVDVVILHAEDPAWTWGTEHWQRQRIYSTPHLRTYLCSPLFAGEEMRLSPKSEVRR